MLSRYQQTSLVVVGSDELSMHISQEVRSQDDSTTAKATNGVIGQWTPPNTIDDSVDAVLSRSRRLCIACHDRQ